GLNDHVRFSVRTAPRPAQPQARYQEIPATSPPPREDSRMLTFHGPVDFRAAIAAAASELGVRPRPTVDTLLAAASQFTVDIAEAERVFVRLAGRPDVA